MGLLTGSAKAHRREEADPFADPTEPLEVDPSADF